MNRLIRERRLRMTQPAVWRMLVRNAARGIRPYLDPVRITFTFFGVRDADNFPKLALDGIVHAGLITDDRYPFVDELILRARPLRERSPYTLVRIEPVMGEELG